MEKVCLILFVISLFSFSTGQEVSTTTATNVVVQTTPSGACGSNITVGDDVGSITSPNFNGSFGLYPNGLNCVWNIAADNPDYRIRISFEFFETETSFDFIRIIENEDDVFMISGNQSNRTPFISSTNSITLMFRTDSSSQDRGFQLIYAAGNFSAQDSCGFSTTATSLNQTIMTPGFGFYTYDENLNCTWIINTPQSDEQIRIYVDVFQTEPSFDFIRIFENEDEVFALSGFRSRGTLFTSTTNSIRLIFQSDGSVREQGFRLLYEAGMFRSTSATDAPTLEPQTTETPATCGFNDVALSTYQAIETPGFNFGQGRYENNLNCTWSISAASPYQQIRIEFEFFVTEEGYDFFEIFQNGFMVFTMSGNRSNPRNFTSSSSPIVLRFRSDNSIIDIGFRLVYKAGNFPTIAPPTTLLPEQTATTAPEECGGNFTATTSLQFIQTPGFDFDQGSYPNNLNCTWNIYAASPYEQIRIEFDLFNTEDGYDFFEIIENSILVFEMSGNPQNPRNFTSSTSLIQLRFRSDQTITSLGFRLTFQAGFFPITTTQEPPTTAEPETCGSDIVATSSYGYIETPGFNFNEGQYTNDLNCLWRIMAENSFEQIQIEFVFFNTEAGYDFFDIFENNDIVFTLSGNQSNIQSFTSRSNSIDLQFSTDFSVVRPGFRLRYRAGIFPTTVPPTTETTTSSPQAMCGSNAMANETLQTIQSPGYGMGNYTNNLNCTWMIMAAFPGDQIRIDFIDFDTEIGFDFIEIFENNVRVLMLSGIQSNVTFTSSGNIIRIVFRTDGSVVRPGFNLQFSTTTTTTPEPPTTTAPETCGSDIVATSSYGYIQTPGFNFNEGQYTNDLNCLWRIMAENSFEQIQIEFVFFNTEAGYDFFDIFENNDIVFTLSGNQSNIQSFTSRSNSIDLQFSTDFSVVRPGFRLRYRAGIFPTTVPPTTETTTSFPPAMCGSNAMANEALQTIQSPGYGMGNYMNNLNCTWVIMAAFPGDQIRIDFIEFNTEIGFDFIEIFENNVRVLMLSGIQSNVTFTSSGNMIRIVFRTDGSVVRPGFNLQFSTRTTTTPEPPTTTAPETCGSDVVATSSYGYIQTPGFNFNEGQYTNDLNCSWRIMAENSLEQIQIEFVFFSTEAGYDFFDIFENNDIVFTLSGNQSNIQSFTSRSNSIDLQFSTDFSVVRPGFRLRYRAGIFPTTVPPTTETTTSSPPAMCGSNAMANETLQTIQSPGYGMGNYMNNLNCTWMIMTAFPGDRIRIEFIEFDTEIGFDFIEIFENNIRVLMLSGIQSNVTFTSSGNMIRIVFRTDGSVVRPGFNLQFSATNSVTTPPPTTTGPPPTTPTTVNVTDLTCPSVERCNGNQAWLCYYIRWKIQFFTLWKPTFEDWRNRYFPSPTSHYYYGHGCNDLYVSCINPNQYRYTYDPYGCYIGYCQDGYYQDVPTSVMETFKEDETKWRQYYNSYVEAINNNEC